MALASVSDLMLPTIMSNIVNYGINEKNMTYIYSQGALMLCFALLSIICYFFFVRLNAKLCSEFNGNLMKKIFGKVNDMSFDQFSSIGAGALLTRTTEDVELLSEAISMFVRMIVNIPIVFVGSVVLTFMKSAKLALVLLAFAPFLIVVVAFIGKKMFPLWKKSDEYCDKQNQVLRERLSGIRVIRAFNREDHECKRLSDATDVMANNIIRANIMGGLINPIALLLLNMTTVIILFVGSRAITPGGKLSAADIMAITQYISMIMSSIMMFVFAIIFMPRLKVKCNRIGDVLNQQTVDRGKDGLPLLKGDIKFNGVNFKYDEKGEEYALKNVSLDIREGETVALLGGTGSGKSTVMKLIMGFYKPIDGEISIEGYNYNDLTGGEIRNNMSCVLQRSTVFSDTVRDNVRMGKEDATDEEIWNALSISQIKEYIEELGEGLDHYLEQGGSNLSGGQKQRIAIARAIIKPASVYIFDDSFSALDFITEAKLRKQLNEKLKGKTQIIITQRVSTGMSADKIYVFDKGELVGTGKHSDLVENCAVYRDIFKSQTGGDML